MPGDWRAWVEFPHRPRLSRNPITPTALRLDRCRALSGDDRHLNERARRGISLKQALSRRWIEKQPRVLRMIGNAS
jgi:hypothetical protein